jgi:hypothetical protein|tara:strand:+ start:1520 stop:2044 length:525 start_codon:yes stop_codon:yes gene_type:complete
MDNYIINEKKKYEILNNMKNGRIDIDGNVISSNKMSMINENNDGNSIYKHFAVSAIYEKNCLQMKFFSEENILKVHSRIQNIIYTKTNKSIARQDNDALKIIMKSIYLQYSKNLPDNINVQVNKLNQFVLDYCVDNIISNMEMYKTYVRSVSKLPVPLEHPKYLSNSGTKSKSN